MMIALLVMICGFALSSRQEAPSAEETVAADAPVPAETATLETRFDPILERQELFADEEALYRATLWLARCIYSETNRPEEQELVAWVVRNRVETRYRGESDYSRVVMDPYQFSAFNRRSPLRDFLLTTDTTYAAPRWQRALDISRRVIMAEASERPFPRTTRHFYSERSLGEYEVPLWSIKEEPVEVEVFEIDRRRFLFYDGVS